MREHFTAAKIVALALGFVAAVASYPFWDDFMFIPIAVVCAVATGVLVYALAVRLIAELF